MIPQAIFLDRDGTINFDYGYLGDVSKVEILDGVIDGMLKLKEKFPGIIFIVISNQAGIARGLITLEQVRNVNSRIQQLLNEKGITVSKFYHCPFHPEFSSEEDSKCRKPSPEMLFEAANDFNLNLTNTYFIGDRHTDIESGLNAGTKTILLKSEIYPDEAEILNNKNAAPDFIANNFLEVAEFIIGEANGGN